ncbi:circadian clock protein PASD1 [Piliocolobus tephrosceles]|uniref:circadian clock protein PASD1 n=1 Tax=Piliocolobus tephrosceles TaxID=591936 RepID=UPI000C29948B|nr:circadian clock protein PASD1 [Piliocolobus tephrosceles]
MRMRERKRRDKVNPKSSQRKLNWIPSFRTYDDFNQMMLQLLDAFMITLSADGVIIHVAENISSLLGHLPAEIVGKKLLSLLPDEEKDEVYQKIILRFPLLISETHIEFCCHLKRGNVEHGDSSAYEYVKFIVNVRDICNESTVVFSGLFSNHLRADLSAACIPQEDRFYLVGNVCILRTQLLRQLYTSKAVSDEAELIQDSHEEPFVGELSSSQGQRGHTSMEVVYVEPAAATSAAAAAAISDDQIDIAEVEQYGPQENVHVMFVDSDSTYCSSTVSLYTIPESPALSLQDFQVEPEVNPLYRADPVDLEFSVDQEGPMDQQDPENPVDLLDQAGLMDPEDSVDLGAAGASAQVPLKPSSPVAYNIISRELELMKELKEQLEERTQLLHDAIQNQQNALELMMDQLQKQPSTLCHIVSPDLQSSEAVPKKQHTGQVKWPLSHPKEVKCFCGLSLSKCLKNTGELQEPCVAFNQQQLTQQEQHLKEQQRQLRKQLQQLREQRKVQKQKKMQEKKMQEKKKLQERKKWQGQMLQKEPKEKQQSQQLQEQPLKHNVIVGNQRVQICLQNPSGVSVPLCNNPVRLLQTQPIVPIQIVAEQQSSGFYQDENWGQQEDESQSFYPEAYQGPPMNQLPWIDTSNSKTISSSSIPQPPITSDSTISTLETPEDYIQLWQQLSDPLRPAVVQVNTWTCDEQGILHRQPPYHQVQVSEVGVEGPPGP